MNDFTHSAMLVWTSWASWAWALEDKIFSDIIDLCPHCKSR